MEGANASMSMADENIRRIDFYFTRMIECYRGIREMNSDLIKPMIDDAIVVWVHIFNKVKKIDIDFYNKLEKQVKECERISRENINKKLREEQVIIFEKLTDLVRSMTEATDLIGIGILVKTR